MDRLSSLQKPYHFCSSNPHTLILWFVLFLWCYYSILVLQRKIHIIHFTPQIKLHHCLQHSVLELYLLDTVMQKTIFKM